MGKCYTVLVICGKSLTSTPVLNLREWESVRSIALVSDIMHESFIV